MPYFAVIVERGAVWDWSLPMRRQKEWDAHAAFMDALVTEGFILIGGPLGNEDTAARILHVVQAAGESAVRERLAEDPWHRSGMLTIAAIEPWTVLLGSIGS